MGKFKPSTQKASGPSAEQLQAQKDADSRVKQTEERTNKELSSASRFAVKRRTGRRLLLAPGREDELASLSGDQTGGNF